MNNPLRRILPRTEPRSIRGVGNYLLYSIPLRGIAPSRVARVTLVHFEWLMQAKTARCCPVPAAFDLAT